MSTISDSELVNILEAMRDQLGAFGISTDNATYTIAEATGAILESISQAITETVSCDDFCEVLVQSVRNLEATISDQKIEAGKIIKAFDSLEHVARQMPSRLSDRRTAYVLSGPSYDRLKKVIEQARQRANDKTPTTHDIDGKTTN